MSIPLIDLDGQHRGIEKELKSAVNRVLSSRRFVLSESVHRLEKSIAEKTGARFALGLNSGTDALLLALAALGIGPGDEVITTPFTFFATAGSISRAGAKPVFVDIDESFNIDPSQIQSRITRRTKAIIPVHLFGLPCDMKAVMGIARKRGLAVIEDAAQSFGAEAGGRQSGSIGDAGCYSFYPTKNLGGAGDGGMLVTSSAKLAERVRILRDHGQTKKYHHEFIGMNSRLDEIQAAILEIKLKRVDGWNAARRKWAGVYNKAFRGLPLETPTTPSGRTHIFHLYSVLTSKRDALAQFLAKRGIGCGVYYPVPLHLQPCYRNLGYRKGDLPMAEKAAREVLSLPMYAELRRRDVDAVIAAVKEFFGGRR